MTKHSKEIEKKIIVVITDCSDSAINEIHGTLFRALLRLGALDKVKIAPVVKAEEFSLINGAFLLRLMADNYPPRCTVFLVILNPLRTNRKDRARLIGETKNGFKFVGANTGTLSWLLKDFGVHSVYKSSSRGLNGKDFISFGGKYVHAPIAAKIASGIPLEKIGEPVSVGFLTHLSLQAGTIVHIDNFGVAKIYGECPRAKEGEIFQISVNNKPCVRATFTYSMKSLPDNTWAIYSGSSLEKLPEVGLVRGNGAEKLNLKIGDKITWKKMRG